MSFWQRLFFPKTAQLADTQAALQAERSRVDRLIDAVVCGRGESPVFEPRPPKPPSRSVTNPFTAENEAWRRNAEMEHDERVVSEAASDENEYNALYAAAMDGQAWAAPLLERADRLIVQQMQAENQEVQ
jgi:hypothetical protein